MAPITHYLRSSPLLFANSPMYDDKGRQLPFDESPIQRRERHAFVKSLQTQGDIATWVQTQRHSHSHSRSPTHTPSSSESSSPHTPASPLNTLHIHTPQQDLPQAALDAELSKLALAAFAAQSVAPPQHRQSRNYKNLHLPNTPLTSRYQSRSRQSQQQPKTQPSKLARGIFDSSSYTYPSAETDMDHLENEEPYLFYSSTIPKRLSTVTTSGIGEFPMPVSRSSASSMTQAPQTLSSPSPRSLTFSKQLTVPPLSPAPTPSRIGDH